MGVYVPIRFVADNEIQVAKAVRDDYAMCGAAANLRDSIRFLESMTLDFQTGLTLVARHFSRQLAKVIGCV